MDGLNAFTNSNKLPDTSGAPEMNCTQKKAYSSKLQSMHTSSCMTEPWHTYTTGTKAPKQCSLPPEQLSIGPEWILISPTMLRDEEYAPNTRQSWQYSWCFPIDIPDSLWLDLAADFTYQGKEHLLVYNTSSKYPFVYRALSKTANSVQLKTHLTVETT